MKTTIGRTLYAVLLLAVAAGSAHAARDIATGVSVVATAGEPAQLVIGSAGEGPNRFDLISTETARNLSSIDFFSPVWTAVASAVVADGNQDGVADDPAVAVLATNSVTGQHKVQLRDAASGTQLGTNIAFFNSSWDVYDLAVLADSDGNGTADDAALMVLGRNQTDGRILTELRFVSGGAAAGRWKFFTPVWTPVSLTAVDVSAGGPAVAVLATSGDTGSTKIQLLDIGTSAKTNVFVFGSDIAPLDLGLTVDGNGDTVADDPAFVVLGRRDNGNNIVRLRDLASGAKLTDITLLNDSWQASGMVVVPDQNFSSVPEVVALAANVGNGTVVAQMKDLGDGTKIATLEPDNPDPGAGISLDVGTGNTIDELTPTVYAKEYAVVVTDFTGAPIAGKPVSVSVAATTYRKGYWFVNAADEWQQNIEAQCAAEDVNRNGALDFGEDVNANGALDPGGLVALAPLPSSLPLSSDCSSLSYSGPAAVIESNALGLARFCMIYAQDVALWAEVEITARATEAAVTAEDTMRNYLFGNSDDYDDTNVLPPGQTSPFGVASICTDPN